MAKFLIRSYVGKTYYDISTIEKARNVAKDSAESNPGHPAEIYQLIELCEVPVKPAKFTAVEQEAAQ